MNYYFDKGVPLFDYRWRISFVSCSFLFVSFGQVAVAKALNLAETQSRCWPRCVATFPQHCAVSLWFCFGFVIGF